MGHISPDEELELLLRELRSTGSREPRLHPRKAAEIPVSYYRVLGKGRGFQTRAEAGRTRNLSRGGVCIEGLRELKFKEVVLIELVSPTTSRVLKAVAQVRWAVQEDDQHVTGLQFLRFVDDATARRAREAARPAS